MEENKENIAASPDEERNKIWGILAYIFFLVPLLAAPKDSQFSKYHINQGLILLITSILLNIVFQLVASVFTGFFISGNPMNYYSITTVFAAIRSLLNLGILVLGVYGILNAAKGQMTPLPIIGNFEIYK